MKARFLFSSILAMSFVAAMGVPALGAGEQSLDEARLRMNKLQFDSFQLTKFTLKDQPIYLMPLDGLLLEQISYDGEPLNAASKQALEKTLKQLISCGYKPGNKIVLFDEREQTFQFEGAFGLYYNPADTPLWEQTAAEKEPSLEALAGCVYYFSGQYFSEEGLA